MGAVAIEAIPPVYVKPAVLVYAKPQRFVCSHCRTLERRKNIGTIISNHGAVAKSDLMERCTKWQLYKILAVSGGFVIVLVWEKMYMQLFCIK